MVTTTSGNGNGFFRSLTFRSIHIQEEKINKDKLRKKHTTIDILVPPLTIKWPPGDLLHVIA